jgi:hypothetical protein
MSKAINDMNKLVKQQEVIKTESVIQQINSKQVKKVNFIKDILVTINWTNSMMSDQYTNLYLKEYYLYIENKKTNQTILVPISNIASIELA